MRSWLTRLNEINRAMLIGMSGFAFRTKPDEPAPVPSAETAQAMGLVMRAYRWIAALKARLAAEAALFPRTPVQRVRIEPAETLTEKPAGTLPGRRRRRRDKEMLGPPLPEDDIAGKSLAEVIEHICIDLCEAAHLLGDNEARRKILAIVKAMAPMLRKMAAPVTHAVAGALEVVAVAMTPAAAVPVGAFDTG